MSPTPFSIAACLALAILLPPHAVAADQPQWGAAWTRNLASEEKNLPDTFDLETGRNVLWSVPLGTSTHSTPIVTQGRIYLGTNNEVPRDPQVTGDRGILLCLDEKDGHLLWQLAVPKRAEDQYFDWPKMGVCSPVTVQGDHVYVVTNRAEVLCLDALGMANGNAGPFREEAAHATPHSAPPPAFLPALASAGDRAGAARRRHRLDVRHAFRRWRLAARRRAQFHLSPR